MDRDTIIFTGASHTFGLGLEWELDPELNSEEYLQKGISLPIPRPKSYQKYWRENRWPTLVCNEFGYKQYTVHDIENKIKIGGNAVETLWMMINKEDELQDLFSKTKYVVLEIGGNVRWYDEELHGGIDGDKYPNTIVEMLNLINNPNSDVKVLEKTLQWILNVDPLIYSKELTDKILYLIKKYPEINFVILPWHTSEPILNSSNILKNNIVEIKENNKKYSDVNEFLINEKIQVWHKAKGFNGNYKYNMVEQHASIVGHKRVAKMVINHIKKLENEQ
jgi:hypothetical protein